jgi:hypothetical protein
VVVVVTILRRTRSVGGPSVTAVMLPVSAGSIVVLRRGRMNRIGRPQRTLCAAFPMNDIEAGSENSLLQASLSKIIVGTVVINGAVENSGGSKVVLLRGRIIHFGSPLRNRRGGVSLDSRLTGVGVVASIGVKNSNITNTILRTTKIVGGIETIFKIYGSKHRSKSRTSRNPSSVF